jgi:glucosamine-6-phosphate deaminase
MQLVWCDPPASFDSLAADKVLDALARKPNSSVALPTGRTPLGLYGALRARAGSSGVSFAQARWFNLDEYVGLAPDYPSSYAHFLRVHLFQGLGVPDSHIRLLRGDAPDLAAECRDFEASIERAGGLDLAILGLGQNGHIAFNEPGSSWEESTRVVELSPQTRAINSQGGTVYIPLRGVTMGVATLRRAREVLLLVSGDGKRDALDALRRGRPDHQWPVTSLIDHPALTVIADGRLR